MIYPVITLYQPWATWIMRGWKTIETRTHNRFASLLHQTILIHAGQINDRYAVDAFYHGYLTREQLLHDQEEMINGFILGSAHVDATGWLCGHSYENKAALIETTERYGLFLTDVKKFDQPIPEKGEMGIWYFDMSTGLKVRKSAREPHLF